MQTPNARTLEKGLALLSGLIGEGPPRRIGDVATEIGIPLSTAHRILATLRASGFIVQPGRGVYLPGQELIRIARAAKFENVLCRVARPVLNLLARETGLAAHLGAFERSMVTYLVKAEGRLKVPTREGIQLEAYCTGIGKVLLANLPERRIAAYLSSGPFVQLTPSTVVEKGDLTRALKSIRQQGFAVDEGEFEQDLNCLAVPLPVVSRGVRAAISLSAPVPDGCELTVPERLASLNKAASKIAGRLAGAL